MKAVEKENDMIILNQKLDFERQKKELEFQYMLERAKTEKVTAIPSPPIKNQIKTIRPVVVPMAPEKMYIPELTNLHPEE